MDIQLPTCTGYGSNDWAMECRHQTGLSPETERIWRAFRDLIAQGAGERLIGARLCKRCQDLVLDYTDLCILLFDKLGELENDVASGPPWARSERQSGRCISTAQTADDPRPIRRMARISRRSDQLPWRALRRTLSGDRETQYLNATLCGHCKRSVVNFLNRLIIDSAK